MRTLALPIRVTRDGQLERAEAGDSLLRLIQAMVASSSGSFPHAPWFGLNEAFTHANMALQDQQRLKESLNKALTELGVDYARVQSVKTARADDPASGERRFDITLVLDGERPTHGQLSI